MDIVNVIVSFFSQAGAAGIMGLALVYVYRQGQEHYEAEIAYLRAKNDDHEKRIFELETRLMDILQKK